VHRLRLAFPRFCGCCPVVVSSRLSLLMLIAWSGDPQLSSLLWTGDSHLSSLLLDKELGLGLEALEMALLPSQSNESMNASVSSSVAISVGSAAKKLMSASDKLWNRRARVDDALDTEDQPLAALRSKASSEEWTFHRNRVPS